MGKKDSLLHLEVGEYVEADEEVATIETDKIDISVNAPESGTLLEQFAKEDDTVIVGSDLYKLELGGAPKEGGAASSKPKEEPVKEQPKQEKAPAPAAPAAPAPAPAATAAAQAAPAPAPAPAAPKEQPKVAATVQSPYGDREERRIKMNRMRLRIAERLKESQNTAASLTTFNEVDMSSVMNMRSEYKEEILKETGVKLGFMSAFVRASILALQKIPAVNAAIEGQEMVFRDYVDMSIAVATPKGLVTPVVRNAEKLSFVEIEKSISDLGAKARDNKITLEDLAGGTFTISNGGVYGSMMGK